MALQLMGAAPTAKEIGSYLDFHVDANKGAKNYDIRLQARDSELDVIGSRGDSSTIFKVGNNFMAWTDSEGGNIRIYSPSQAYSYEMDAYNHSLRIGGRKVSNGAFKSITLLDTDGYSTFNRAYNAVYNDYAEFFPRGEDTEPGDIIALDDSVDQEQYVKATIDSCRVVGIHSNEYAFLIGGENPPEGQDFYSYNISKYIPVGLAGRCRVKVLGPIRKGQDIIPTSIPGIGRAFNREKDNPSLLYLSVGFAVENSTDESIKLVRAKLK